MSVIAWDGKTMVADRQVSYGNMIGSADKARRVESAEFDAVALVGCTGDAMLIIPMFEWIEGGCDPDSFPKAITPESDFMALVVMSSGSTLVFGTSPHPVFQDPGIFAIGSGRDFAMAAMYLGKSAREAVEVASHFDITCGCGVTELTF